MEKPSKKICKECGKEFMPSCEARHYCKNCKKKGYLYGKEEYLEKIHPDCGL